MFIARAAVRLLGVRCRDGTPSGCKGLWTSQAARDITWTLGGCRSSVGAWTASMGVREYIVPIGIEGKRTSGYRSPKQCKHHRRNLLLTTQITPPSKKSIPRQLQYNRFDSVEGVPGRLLRQTVPRKAGRTYVHIAKQIRAPPSNIRPVTTSVRVRCR